MDVPFCQDLADELDGGRVLDGRLLGRRGGVEDLAGDVAGGAGDAYALTGAEGLGAGVNHG
jgi:hypothetical protein